MEHEYVSTILDHMTSDKLVYACGVSEETVRILVNAGCPMTSDALIRACNYSTGTVRILVNAGCPMTADALIRACTFSTEAVRILVDAGCPMTQYALINACILSKEAVRILVNAGCPIPAYTLFHARGISSEYIGSLLKNEFPMISTDDVRIPIMQESRKETSSINDDHGLHQRNIDVNCKKIKKQCSKCKNTLSMAAVRFGCTECKKCREFVFRREIRCCHIFDNGDRCSDVQDTHTHCACGETTCEECGNCIACSGPCY